MSKKLINGKILAIQLGRNETQIALVGKNAEILHGITVATPLSAVEDGMIYNQEGVTEMLKEALKTPKFKGVRQVVFTLCTSQVIMETATVPEMPKAKLEKLIQANADMYFPVDIKDYRLIWEIIGSKKNEAGTKEVTVQLWAVPNEMLRRYYQAANACGLSVAAIDYCGHSAATAVGASFSRPAKPPKAKASKVKDPEAPKEPKPKKKIDWNAEITFGKKKKKVEPDVSAEAQAGPRPISATDLHILMDAELLGLTFVQEGQVVYQRFYRCGADPSYQFSELAMMVEYFQTQDIGRDSEITGYVSGPGSADTDMVEMLSGMLGMVLTPFRTGQDPRWLLCIGASRTNLEFGNPSFNTTVRVRRTINTDLWQYAAILASGAALVAMVLMLLNARLDWSSEISGLENEYTILSGQAAKVNGFKENYESYQTAYDAYDRDWDALFDSLHTYNDNLVFVLKELESVMPENTSVTDIIIDSDSVMISFACDDKEEAAYLIMSLRDMEYVDVNTISNLIGGGKGAATEYGTPIEEVTPPSEGGSLEQVATVPEEERVRSGVSPQADVSPTVGALKDLESRYGKVPVTKLSHPSLADLKSKHTLTATQRQEAIRALLSTNPMIANSFVNMLYEDLYRSGSGNGYIVPILLDSGIAMSQPSTYAEAQVMLEQAITILTKEENLDAAERFLCAGDDPNYTNTVTYDLQTAYVHYLEAVLDLWNVPKDASGKRLFDQYCPYLKVPASEIDTTLPGGQWLYEQTASDVLPDEQNTICPTCCTHVDSNTDNFCDNCGTNMGGGEPGCKHENKEACARLPEVFGEELKHMFTCADCGETVPEEACKDGNNDNKCDSCEAKMSVTRKDIENLLSIYAKVPQPGAESPKDLKSFLEEKDPTYYQREAAIINLFNTNAFAANSIVEPAIEMMYPSYKGFVKEDDKFETVRLCLELVMKELGGKVNEELLKKIESLICTVDSDYGLETAYLYYLEVAMGEQTVAEGEYPHLEAKDESQSDWNNYAHDYIANILDEEGMAEPRTPSYAYLMALYLQGKNKDAVEDIDEETLAALKTYFFEGGAGLEEIGIKFDELVTANEQIINMLTSEFYLYKYQPDMTYGGNIRELVEDYGNELITGNDKLLLALKKSETQAEVTKDLEQDKTLEEHEKEIEELKKQLEALKGDAEGEEQGGGASSGAVAGDTRVFLDIGLLYTDELWNQELQRKGLNRDAKLPKLELEVG